MKTLTYYMMFWLFCLLHVSVWGKQTYSTYQIRHIGHVDGLSHQRVFSIVEDKHHVMWIATKAGIDRFNGQTVKNYQLSGDFHHGDMAGRRLKLCYYADHGLWAYDHSGRIYRYSVEKDCFELLFVLSAFIPGEIILNKISLDADGMLWLGLSKGLFCMEQGGTIHAVMKGEYVNEILPMADYLYIGTSDGMVIYDKQAFAVVKKVARGTDVLTLYFDKGAGQLWMGTFQSGLLRMDLAKDELWRTDAACRALKNPIRAITGYDSDNLLVGIDGGGVYTVGKTTDNVSSLFTIDDHAWMSLKGNGVYAVTKDYQGNIWIGSYTGGVSVAVLLRYPIGVFMHEYRNVQSLGNDNVNGVMEHPNGNLWFATDRGISILQMPSSSWKHVLTSAVVVCLCKGQHGLVWVGTYGDGVYLLDSEGKVLAHYTKQRGGLTTNSIFSIVLDEQQHVWIGGLDGDLLKMSPQGEVLQTFGVKWIHSLQPVGKNQMAVATVDGFCLITIDSGEMVHYAGSQENRQSNTSAYIISMCFNEDDTVWLGTEGGGLNLYNMRSREVKTFTVDEGMPSNDVFSIQKDFFGRVWISTGKGLALVENNQVFNLNYLHEVEREYNKSSFTQLADGQFLYGSTSGAVCLFPHLITHADYQAPLRFTGMLVENLGEQENREAYPLIYDQLQRKSIRLDYAYNSFTVYFESINYRFQSDIAYQYILDGYETEWSLPSTDGKVKYVKVSPGHYRLKVRSLRKNSGEVLAEEVLAVSIAPPWWNSWYAWLVYLCLGAGVFYVALRFKSGQLQKRYDEDKIRFFVDTAHDIRTPVTLIMAPLEDLSKEELTDNARYYLDLARHNTAKLHDLVGQLMDFERMEQGKYTLHPLSVSMKEILMKEYANFQHYGKSKQLEICLQLPSEEYYVWSDPKVLEMIFDNLLSNACKYTPQGGEIRISLYGTQHKVCVEIQDTGIGIPPKEQKLLFSTVHRAENARKSQEEGSGFGLLQVHRLVKLLQGKISFRSKENQGTTFTLTFKRAEPVPQDGVVPNEKKTLMQPELSVSGAVPLPASEEAAQKDGETLLIVEDHDALRHYLRKVFEKQYRVVEAAHGEAALDYLKHEYPDLILSDVMMPGIQGDELCRLVKENLDTAGIPFVLLTAKTNHEAMVQGLQKGADDYIPKPFTTEILQLKIQGLLENRRRQRNWLMKHALRQVEQETAETHPSQEKRVEVSSGEETSNVGLSESDRQFVEKATQIVMDFMSQPDFNINALCQEMAMSRTLFYSRLKSLTGQGPQDFIRMIRLQKAAELLKEGKGVNDVSVETGFVNAKYFSILFKKHFGVQPSKYEKS